MQDDLAPVAPPRAMVPALTRGVAILDLLADAAAPLSLSDISRKLGLAKSSALGLCETLVELDLARREGKGYRIGARPITWAQAFSRGSDLLREFRYLIAKDPELSRYTVSLSQLEGDHITYLASHQAVQPLGFTFAPGVRLPAVYTATGKAILAALPEALRDEKTPQPWPAPLTADSVTRAHWPDQIRRWQQLGYALDREELRPGLICIGVTIDDSHGYPLGGLALSLTLQEADQSDVGQLAKSLSNVAKRLAPLYG